MRLILLIIPLFLLGCTSGGFYRSVSSSDKNRFRLIDNEDDAFNIRMSLLAKEEKEIFASFHIWDGNKVGGLALAQLMRKARSGVKVRLLLEGFGPIPWHDLFLVDSIFKVLKENNVDVRIWNPTSPRDPRTYLFESRQKRNHDKILYLADQRVVYEGDRNMQNINFRMQKTRGRRGHTYKSLDIVVEGDAINETKHYLEQAWALSVVPDLSQVKKDEYERMKLRYKRYDALLDEYQSRLDEGWRDSLVDVKGDIRFINYDPSLKGSNFDKDEELLKIIESGEKEVIITSPFSRFPEDYLEAIKKKTAEGVKVVFYFGDVTKYGGDLGGSIYWHHKQELLKAGAEVNIYEGDDFLHAKVVLVDGRKGYIGTHNFNMRSKYLDLESGFVFDDVSVAGAIKGFTQSLDKDSVALQQRRANCRDFLTRLLLLIPKVNKQF